MKEEGKKILGEQRRNLILQWLKESNEPFTGSSLAEKTNVSRQVIVQDISLLKARNEPIVATAQGYLYMQTSDEKKQFQRVIACYHRPEDTENELNILVDHGVTVCNVTIQHQLYGELTASLMISSRRDVQQFLQKIESTEASLLSELTDGTHLHKLEADTEEQLNEACQALEKSGYLLSSY
ncbi:transcription repressor NadR [Bacillus taeanensis]|uniref:Transcription repressor NadR n=1 Tax=Bacillus taeanensis TaxID=273032 RepID=A0A366Y3N1_9BACI|nr:transcription repressor NadR [Bacillus taeanensis]RBW71609.1 transcription repressor NadR [Bacillus taeanensis]